MIENLLNKLASRKFWVLIFATILLLFKGISEDTWLKIALFWIGIEGINDIIRGGIEAWRKAN